MCMVLFMVLGARITIIFNLSGTGDLQSDSRESIRASHSQLKDLFL